MTGLTDALPENAAAITLYEWHENGRFEPMKDAEGNSREALIQFDNGLYEPRHARILRKNWPR